jgi:hypothetical protein
MCVGGGVKKKKQLENVYGEKTKHNKTMLLLLLQKVIK